MRSTAPVPVRSAGPRRSLVAGRPLAASPTGNGFAQATRNLSIAAACPYRTLGLRPGDEVSDVDIKAAFRAKAKALHPDTNQTDPLSALAFMDVQRAYQTLLDPEARAKYDRSLMPKGSASLAYLNARSAARHGVTSSRIQRAPIDGELHHTMLELLRQVKSCTTMLQHEVLGAPRDARARPRPNAAAQQQQPPVQQAPLPPATRDEAQDCGEHGECAEPWLYYALVTTQQTPPSSAPRRR